MRRKDWTEPTFAFLSDYFPETKTLKTKKERFSLSKGKNSCTAVKTYEKALEVAGDVHFIGT